MSGQATLGGWIARDDGIIGLEPTPTQVCALEPSYVLSKFQLRRMAFAAQLTQTRWTHPRQSPGNSEGSNQPVLPTVQPLVVYCRS